MYRTCFIHARFCVISLYLGMSFVKVVSLLQTYMYSNLFGKLSVIILEQHFLFRTSPNMLSYVRGGGGASELIFSLASSFFSSLPHLPYNILPPKSNIEEPFPGAATKLGL